MPTLTERRQSTVNDLVAALNSGDLPPWRTSWTVTGASRDVFRPRNGASMRQYNGYNRLRLMVAGRTSPLWYTWKQIQEAGQRVMRGEHATHIEYWQPPVQATGEDEKERGWFGRSYTVFNADQLEGYTPPAAAADLPALGLPVTLRDWRQSLIVEAGLDLRHGPQPCYVPSLDYVALPDPAEFDTVADYYATLAHEVVHWTGHASRLNRLAPVVDRTRLREHTNSYALEELVAEIGSAFLEADLGLDPSEGTQRAAYVAGWLGSCDGPHALAVAASLASRAADYALKAGSVGTVEASSVEEAAS